MNSKKQALVLAATGALALPALLVVGATGSCSLEGLAGGPAVSTTSATGSSTSGASSSSGGGDAGPSCPPDMVLLKSTAGAFCIDRLEVTNSQYAAFAEAAGTEPQKDPPRCSWNSERPSKSDGGSPDQPVVMVHWCNAYEYCASVGKHLCGRVGGGAIDIKEREYGSDEWLVACGNQMTKYPYGLTFDSMACSDCDPQHGCVIDGGAADGQYVPALPDVGSFPGCGYDGGPLDMSGSVWEWEDECQDNLEAGANPIYDHCSRRGGSFAVPGNGVSTQCLSCSCNGGCSSCDRNRGERQIDVGIRCCKEVQ